MAGFSITARNHLLDYLGTTALYVSICTGDAGTGSTASFECTSRLGPVSWNSATGGDLDMTGSYAFEMPSGATATHFALFSGTATTAAYWGCGVLTPNVGYLGGTGTFTLTDADVYLA